MKYDSLFDPLVLLFVGSSYVLTLLVGAFMIQAGQITVGNLVTFITYLDMLVWPLMAIGFLFNITQRGNVSYQRIETLLEQESDVQNPVHPLPSIENGRLEYAIDRFAFEDEDTLRVFISPWTRGKPLAWLADWFRKDRPCQVALAGARCQSRSHLFEWSWHPRLSSIRLA